MNYDVSPPSERSLHDVYEPDHVCLPPKPPNSVAIQLQIASATIWFEIDPLDASGSLLFQLKVQWPLDISNTKILAPPVVTHDAEFTVKCLGLHLTVCFNIVDLDNMGRDRLVHCKESTLMDDISRPGETILGIDGLQYKRRTCSRLEENFLDDLHYDHNIVDCGILWQYHAASICTGWPNYQSV